MADLIPLGNSLKRFTDNVKERIAEQGALSTAEMNKLLDELQAQFEAQSDEAGEGSEALPVSAIAEKKLDLEGNEIDCSLANHWTKTINGATALSVTNVYEAGLVTSLVVHLTNAGNNVTFWAGVRWSNGVKPALSAAGRDVLAFITHDGGVTWDGYLIGQDMKAAA